MQVPPPAFPPPTAEAEAFTGMCASDEQDRGLGAPSPWELCLGEQGRLSAAPMALTQPRHPALCGARGGTAAFALGSPPASRLACKLSNSPVPVPNSPSLNCFSPLFGSLSALDAFASPPSCRIRIGRIRGACSEPPASLRLLPGFLPAGDGSEVAARGFNERDQIPSRLPGERGRTSLVQGSGSSRRCWAPGDAGLIYW